MANGQVTITLREYKELEEEAAIYKEAFEKLQASGKYTVIDTTNVEVRRYNRTKMVQIPVIHNVKLKEYKAILEEKSNMAFRKIEHIEHLYAESEQSLRYDNKETRDRLDKKARELSAMNTSCVIMAIIIGFLIAIAFYFATELNYI